MDKESEPLPARKISRKSEDPDLRFKYWQLVATYSQLAIAIAGIFFVWGALTNNAKSLRSATQQSMVKLVTDMDKVFVDKPDLYPYFYQCQDIDSTNGLYHQASAAAVQMLDLMDIAATQNSTFKDQWDTPQAWDDWIKDQLLRSPIVRDRLKAYHTWYGGRLNTKYQEVEDEMKKLAAQNKKPCE